jgi:hypothetical protein
MPAVLFALVGVSFLIAAVWVMSCRKRAGALQARLSEMQNDRTQQEKLLGQWLGQNQSKKMVIIECGAGTGVPTVRWTSEKVLNLFDATLIRINVREPEAPSGAISIARGAHEVLEKISLINQKKEQ